MIKAGLILEGGAERGVFTAGALDLLLEQDFRFEYVCGVSAGACNAVDYVSEQPGRTRDAMIPKDKSYRMAKISTIPTQHSLIDMDMLFDSFPNELIPFDYQTYFASPIRCEMVVTNCETGEAEYLDDRSNEKRFMDMCRASSSIPVFSQPVLIDGTMYVDGGVGDAVPLLHSMEYGYRKNVVILTRQKGDRKKAPGKVSEAVYSAVFRRYPKLVRKLMTRHLEYNKMSSLIEKWEDEGKIFVLRPEIQPVDRLEMDPEKLTPFYRHGYELMESRLPELKEYLGID